MSAEANRSACSPFSIRSRNTPEGPKLLSTRTFAALKKAAALSVIAARKLPAARTRTTVSSSAWVGAIIARPPTMSGRRKNGVFNCIGALASLIMLFRRRRVYTLYSPKYGETDGTSHYVGDFHVPCKRRTGL